MKNNSAAGKGKNFIRVCLQSGMINNPLGNEELSIFCQCDNDTPSVSDVDYKGLLNWVNSNMGCVKNQSNDRYRISKQLDSVTVVYLNSREISCCQSADRIYPRLAANL